jgi:hypothetical protein
MKKLVKEGNHEQFNPQTRGGEEKMLTIDQAIQKSEDVQRSINTKLECLSGSLAFNTKEKAVATISEMVDALPENVNTSQLLKIFEIISLCVFVTSLDQESQRFQGSLQRAVCLVHHDTV